MKTHRRRRKKLTFTLIGSVLILAIYTSYCLGRSMPDWQPQLGATKTANTSAPDLSWPAGSQAAVGIIGTDILQTHGKQTPIATASTAKVITALMVLKQKPLQLGQQGPKLTMSDADVALYKSYVAQDGSVVPVQASETISEYQALQAMMLPSANNMADSLAIWAYGSLKAYSSAANNYLSELGLNQTRVGSDASGLAPDSTSTAADLVKLGKLAMQNPVLAQIVGQSTATGIPLTTTVKNVNLLLGTDNIIGIKTGNSDHVGGAFVGAATAIVNERPEVIVTTVTNAPDLFTAMKQSQTLIKSAQTNFQPVTVVKKNDVVGSYRSAWGATVPILAAEDLKLTAWRGSRVTASVDLVPISNNAAKAAVVRGGTVSASSLSTKKSVAAKLGATPEPPTIWWRLSHPFN